MMYDLKLTPKQFLKQPTQRATEPHDERQEESRLYMQLSLREYLHVYMTEKTIYMWISVINCM